MTIHQFEDPSLQFHVWLCQESNGMTMEDCLRMELHVQMNHHYSKPFQNINEKN